MKTFEEVVGKKKLKEILDTFEYLYGRWQDEHEFEDFNEYKKALERVTGKGTILRMSKRPFIVHLVFKEGEQFFVRCNGRQLQWGAFA